MPFGEFKRLFDCVQRLVCTGNYHAGRRTGDLFVPVRGEFCQNDVLEPTSTNPLTQEFLAIMLGVQRSGVSIALADLQSRGFIASKRRLIVILNRPALEKFTNGSYGLAEAEYKRRVKRSN